MLSVYHVAGTVLMCSYSLNPDNTPEEDANILPVLFSPYLPSFSHFAPTAYGIPRSPLPLGPVVLCSELSIPILGEPIAKADLKSLCAPWPLMATRWEYCNYKELSRKSIQCSCEEIQLQQFACDFYTQNAFLKQSQTSFAKAQFNYFRVPQSGVY